MESLHMPVLMNETLEALAIEPDDVVVDATIGGAGHFSAILKRLGASGTVVGIDADPAAVERGREAYAKDRRASRPTAHVIHDNFRNLPHVLERLGIGEIDKALFDLGWSGYQLAAQRGFSFQKDEPLLMTYGEEGSETVADFVNSASEETLADTIYLYGEERFARKIAKSIVLCRSKERILTTGALVEAILEGTPSWYHKRKIHPATKTFQALRIAINDELGALREGLQGALSALRSGGKLAVISFHSIEDRVVKDILKEAEKSGLGAPSPKKPLVATRSEIAENRRARSAKLRVFERGAFSSHARIVPNAVFSYA